MTELTKTVKLAQPHTTTGKEKPVGKKKSQSKGFHDDQMNPRTTKGNHAKPPTPELTEDLLRAIGRNVTGRQSEGKRERDND